MFVCRDLLPLHKLAMLVGLVIKIPAFSKAQEGGIVKDIPPNLIQNVPILSCDERSISSYMGYNVEAYKV